MPKRDTRIGWIKTFASKGELDYELRLCGEDSIEKQVTRLREGHRRAAMSLLRLRQLFCENQGISLRIKRLPSGGTAIFLTPEQSRELRQLLGAPL